MGINKIGTIIFRTFGGKGIGYGHYYRCISLANAILYHNNQINIKFIINEGLKDIAAFLGFDYIINDAIDKDIEIFKKLEPRMVIIDSYLADDEYLKDVNNISKLVIFDDNNDIYNSLIPDIIINGNIHANELTYKRRKDGIYLFGTDYLVMKREYWKDESNSEKKDEIVHAKNIEDLNVMITTGGSDIYKISLKIIQILSCTNFEKTLIIGPSYSDELINELQSLSKKQDKFKIAYKPTSLKEYIKNSDIVITAGGSTIYEVLSQNKIPIVFNLADNQDLICNELIRKDIHYIGKYPDINYAEIPAKINEISNDIFRGDFKYTNDYIDGKGALRVSKILLNIL